MAKCDLTVHLDEEKETYRPGDVVRGFVEVRTDEEVQCNGLTVGCRWKTHGKGNTDQGKPLSRDLFQGRWLAGAVQRYPFALELPAGPYTYHGHYVNVVWELQAQADIPWAFDPKAEREIVLEPDPEAEPDWLGSVGDSPLLPYELQQMAKGEPIEEASQGSKWLGNALGLGCFLLFGVPMVAGFVVSLYYVFAFARGEAPSGEGIPALVFAVVLGLMLGVGGFKVFRNLVARRKIGKVTFELEPKLLRRGDEIRLQVFCQPQKDTELVTATARLQAKEKAVRGSGTNKKSFRQAVYEEEVEIALGRTLSAGLPLQTQGTMTIPADAPPSFMARDNKLRWTVTLRLDIARWPDWVEKREILVHP